MTKSHVTRDIHFSPFEMVYIYQPEIRDKLRRLKLIEPTDINMGDDISPELPYFKKSL